MAQIPVVKPLVKGGTYPVTNPATTLAAISAVALADLVDGKPGGDEFVNPAGRTYLVLINTGDAAVSVNIQPQGSPDGLSIAPYQTSIPAKSPMVFGAFDPNMFNSAGGNVRFGLEADSAAVFAVVVQT